MSNETVDFALLRTLHRMLRQKTDLNDQLKRSPRKIQIVTQAEAKFDVELEEAKAALTKTTMAAKEKQLQLGSREAKIEELKNKLNGAASNREFQLLKDQIAADEQANSVLSDEILEMLEKMDVLEAGLATAKENQKKAQEETKRVTSLVEGELKKFQLDLNEVSLELEEMEKKIPIDYKIQYDRLVAGLGEDALCSTDTETCGNCHQHLTAQTVSELLLKRAVFCKGCGSWMYVTENIALGRSE